MASQHLPFLFTLSGSLVMLVWIGYRAFERRKRASKAIHPDHPQLNNNDDPISSSESVPLSNILTFEKDNLSLENAIFIKKLLQSPNKDIQNTCLSMLQQASSYSNNFSVIRESGCLHTLLDILSTNEETLLKKHKLTILQISCNVVTDLICLEVVQPHIPVIISTANKSEYSDEACAALQLIANIALTSKGCDLLKGHINVLIQLLSSRDAHMLRQVLTLFVNLSCDDASVRKLLMTHIPINLSTFEHYLSSVDQPVITLKFLHLLKNLYSAIGRIKSDMIPDAYLANQQSFLHFLLFATPDIGKHLELIPSNFMLSDLAADIKMQTVELHRLLMNSIESH